MRVLGVKMKEITKFSVIGCVGVPNNYGGFETLAENLAKYEKFKTTIYCSGKSYKKENRLLRFHNANLKYVNIDANGAPSLLYDAYCLLHAMVYGERNILCLGISGAWIFPVVKLLFSDVKIVTNVDGVEWRRQKFSWLGQKLLRLLHIIAEKYSDVIICDNEGLLPYISKKSQTKVVIIAYGGDHIDQMEAGADTSSDSAALKYGNDYSLAICRIVKENNVEMILEAFDQTTEKLVFMGNWEHSPYSRSLFEQYKNRTNIILMKENYNLSILQELRLNAKHYIHGHSAGGTNPSLVEAMFTCSSIIYFDCVFNKFTLGGAGEPFRSKSDLSQLIKLKGSSNAYPYRELAIERYSWLKICEKYDGCF